MASLFSLPAVLEKLRNDDVDLRHMALYDLNAELRKESFLIDDRTANTLSQNLLKMLGDVSADVQSEAIKCFVPLSTKLSDRTLQELCDELTNRILNEKDGQRDIAAIALRTILSDMTVSAAVPLLRRLLPRLVDGVKAITKPEMKAQCLDVISESIKRFGHMLVDKLSDIQSGVLPELAGRTDALQKKAIMTLATLSLYSSDELFSELMTFLIQQDPNTPFGVVKLHTYIQCLGIISRYCGVRLGHYLDQVIPLLLENAGQLEGSDADDTRESILQAIESIVLRCPREVEPHLLSTLQFCKSMVQYDPNWDSSMDVDESVSGNGSDDDEDDDFESEEEFSDDDDLSWKVRKAACKCISAHVNQHPRFVPEVVSSLLSPQDHILIDRFREREDSVRSDVFSTVVAILRKSYFLLADGEIRRRDQLSASLALVKDVLVQSFIREFGKSKDISVRLSGLNVISELVKALGGGLDSYTQRFCEILCATFAEKSSNSAIKVEILSTLHVLLRFHEPQSLIDSFSMLSDVVYRSLEETYPKIVSESLRVARDLVPIIQFSQDVSTSKNLYQIVLNVLRLHNVNQEIKQRALRAIASILVHVSHLLGNYSEALSLVLERMNNEISRFTALQTFREIIRSSVSIVIPQLSSFFREIISFLKKNDRSLRALALQTLDDAVRKFSTEVDFSIFPSFLNELTTVVDSSDLHLSFLAIKLGGTIVECDPSVSSIALSTIGTVALRLLRSSVIVKSSVQPIARLFSVIRGAGTSFSEVMDRILNFENIQDETKRVSSSAVGQVVAAVCASSSEDDVMSLAETFLSNIQSSSQVPICVFSLYCLGEIGLVLGRHALPREAFDVIVASLQQSDEIREAASVAIGSVVAGDLEYSLSDILSNLQQGSKSRYSYLIALKQAIEVANHDRLASVTELLLPALYDAVAVGEKDISVRLIISECLGKLIVADPEKTLPSLFNALNSSNLVRLVALTSLISALTDSSLKNSDYLRDICESALALFSPFDYPDMEDVDAVKLSVEVEKASILLFNSIIRRHTSLIIDKIHDILPKVYHETRLKAALLHEVDLGPFKHTCDDGLDLRKAAYECMDSLLDHCFEFIHMSDFVDTLTLNGLLDHDFDVRVQVFLMFEKVSRLSPESLFPFLDSMVDPFSTTLTLSVKKNSVSQDEERVRELKRSAVQSCKSIFTAVGSNACLRFTDLVNKQIQSDPVLKEFYGADDELLPVQSPGFSTPIFLSNEASASFFR